MPELFKARWHFAPTGGGAEYGNSAGLYYFVNDAITNTVREVLQNSMDHPSQGIDCVELTCRLMEISPDEIGIPQLKRHIESSLHEVKRDNDKEAIKRYEQMLQAVSKPTIPCLAMIDSGTTGLQGDNWRNLIFREGTPTNSETQTKGGSYGFGKNAPFNLSDCNTVLYSTRYVSAAKKGRVEHLAGRSLLVSHNDPHQPEIKLQQTGFWAVHSPKLNQPLEGPNIPQSLRLKESGTGIFIIGFNTGNYPRWDDETAKAAVTHFFYAIHTKKLVVIIDKGDGTAPRIINRDTLPIELENLPSNDPTHHYWQAIADNNPEITEPSGRLGQMGQLQLWINTGKGAPRRTAHINRRGMFITDSRQRGDNPFYPRDGTKWPEWCAVTMAQDEMAETFIRQMEPPAHDAIHVKQLRETNQQQTADLEVRHQREQITKIIRDRIDQTLLEAGSNISELARMFPDLPDLSQGVHSIKWREVQHMERSNEDTEQIEESEENETDEDPSGEPDIEVTPDPEPNPDPKPYPPPPPRIGSRSGR